MATGMPTLSNSLPVFEDSSWIVPLECNGFYAVRLSVLVGVSEKVPLTAIANSPPPTLTPQNKAVMRV